MALPNDHAIAAFVNDGGELMVISGRGFLWKYDPTKEKDPDKCPASVKQAFANGDRLYVLDGNETFWEFFHNDGTWKKGSKVGDGVDENDESPWVRGAAISTSTAEEEEPTPTKRKSKEAA